MITEEQLRNVFQYAFVSDTEEVVYRKYTTDTIPSYILRLSNASDSVHIKVYVRTPEYINITDNTSGFVLSRDEGIVLPPLKSTEVTITIDPAGVDMSNDESPRLTFELRALEPSDGAPPADSAPDEPTGESEREQPTETTPPTGTGSPPPTDTIFPTRRQRETEVDDFVGPIAQQ